MGQTRGFTLIELSIVLVIIGLIVGGVLVGQNLIAAAGVRATIAQVEKYNTAANTFRGKYGALPGDMSAALATQFGFTARPGTQGWGDNNGVLQDAYAAGTASVTGELCLFWMDLSTANLVDGNFIGGPPGNSASPCTLPWGAVTGPGLDTYFPQAKLGQSNYFYIWSGGAAGGNGLNYYGLSAVSQTAGGGVSTTPVLTAQQAYSMDAKMDDGLPETGGVTIQYENNSQIFWASYNSTSQTSTCFNTTANAYYVNTQGPNCALSFQFQ